MWSELIQRTLEDVGIVIQTSPLDKFGIIEMQTRDKITIWMRIGNGNTHFAHQWEDYDQFIVLPDLANPATDPEPTLKEILVKRAIMAKDGPRWRRRRNENGKS